MTDSSQATPAPTQEEHLADLLDFIAGRGKWQFFGGAFHTHPGYDANNDRIHSACLELERRGLVQRIIDDPGHCCFKAISEPADRS